MAAEGKITLNSKQYEATLNAVKSKTAKAGADMSASMKGFGGEVGGAGKAVSALSSEVGSQFGTIGRVISSLASGPVALLAAAFGTLLAIGVKMWDQLTLSAEEYRAKLSAQIDIEDKRLQKLKAEQKAEKDYMDRLVELSGHEVNTNAEKTEAIRLIQILTSKYGDLGISIDETTGKITGLAEAENKLNKQMKEQAEKQVEKVIGLKRNESASLVRGELMPQNIATKLQGAIFGETKYAKDAAETYKNLSTQGRLEVANEMLWGDNATTDMQEIQFWNDQVRMLNEILDLEEQLNNLRKTGVATTQEETAELEKRSKQERAIDEALENFFSDVDAEAEKQLAEEAEKRWETEKKLTEEYQAQLAAARELEKANRAKKEQYVVGQVVGMRDSALRATGQGKQADIDAAVWAATQVKGSVLDEDEYNRTVEMATLKHELNQALQNRPSGVDFAPRVNSLVARGGSEAPVKMPGGESLQAKSLAQQERIARIADQIFGKLDEWITI